MAYKDFGIKIKPDENFALIVGKDELTPPQMIKAIWNYIKKNNLVHKVEKS